MGRWHVLAGIPSGYEAGTVNNIEEYTRLGENEVKILEILFKFSFLFLNHKKPFMNCSDCYFLQVEIKFSCWGGNEKNYKRSVLKQTGNRTLETFFFFSR